VLVIDEVYYIRSPVVRDSLTFSLSCPKQPDGGNVILNWQDNSTNEIEFYVERCQGAGCSNFTGVGVSGGANITTWTDDNVSAGQSYSYRVRTWNSDGYSNYSNTAMIATPGGPSTSPPAPSNLVARAVSKNQIPLTWTNNTSNQDGVIVEGCKGATCTNFSQIGIVTGTAYTDSGLWQIQRIDIGYTRITRAGIRPIRIRLMQRH
jgi:hypothetical protein